MAIGDISLTASTRANLTSLQNTAKLLGQTQSHLSSGKKVNSALDNATSYFASQGFLNSANDLAGLKDSMATALQTIKAASDAITSIKNVVTQLQGLANSALQSTDNTVRSGYATQYNGLLSQLDSLANDATFNGTNLVNSVVSQLKVIFNASNTTSLVVSGANLKSSGLGIGSAQNSFATGSLAASDTYTQTVTSTAANTTGAYSGTLDLTGRITGAVANGANSGRNVVMASSATDFNPDSGVNTGGNSLSDGATVTVNSTGAGGLMTYNSGNAAFLGTQVSGLQLKSGTAIGTADISATTIQGQFTATGAAAGTATFDNTTNVLTSTAGNDVTLTVNVGDSIQINYTQGGNAQHAVYKNEGTTAVTINLKAVGAADTVSVGSTGKANSSVTYNLTGGTISTANYAGLSLAQGQTISGSRIVDAGGATTGMAVTTYATSDGTGLALGTTTTAGVTTYDTAGSTISGITIANVKATVSGTASASYALTAGSTITVTGAKQLTGSRSRVVADAITTAQNQLTSALSALRTAGSSLGNNNTLVQTRQDFTSNLIDTLQTASDNLVLADTNEEGANMQSLQARNQLGIVSLSISGQLAQSILKLF